MNIVSSWKNSLQVLHPDNLKNFLLVSLKTVGDVYGVMNHPLPARGNWFVAAALIILISLTNIINYLNLYWLEALLNNTFFHSLVFLFCLVMRPSVGVKNLEYYRFYLHRFWWLLLISVVLGGFTPIFVVPLFFMTYIFFILFCFDTHGSIQELIQALRNSAVMLIYNLPLCVVFYVALAVVNYIFLYNLVAFVLGYWGGLTMVVILYLFFIPIEVSLLTNFYIKRLHDQPELYFVQPK